MEKWTIDKQFSFCYGHRVWSQQLEVDYCERNDTKTKCRHLHGHEGLVHVYLESNHLERGMVTDFKHLGWLKNFLDDNIDHRFIIDKNDPHFQQIINGHINLENVFVPENYEKTLPIVPIKVPGTEVIAGYDLDCYTITDGPTKEFYEGFFIIDFIPTSENLCKWLFDIVSVKMKNLGVKVSKLDWWETPKSRSSISADNTKS